MPNRKEIWRLRYAWRLEIAVWTEKRRVLEGEETIRPRLMLVQRDWLQADHDGFSERAMGWVEYEPKDRHERGGWTAFHLPERDWLPAAYSEGQWTFQERLLLREGERKYPRDSAKGAMDALLEQVRGAIPPPEFQSVAKVGPMFLEPLKQMMEMHLRRHPALKRSDQ